MSDAYHEMAGLLDKINVFDESIGEKGEHGSRLKQAMLKVDRDKGQGKYIRIILKTVNNNAQRMINATSAAFIAIGKNFKRLLEDLQRKPAEIIMNWKELESASEEPIGKRLTDDYKRMYYFVQLLQFFTGPIEEEDTPPASLN
jgi:Txe/YoeB family toxin of Txe-Axe toxin-antitoxin module